MTYFALIRHGSFVQPQGVPSAHLPHPLDALGRKQARENAALLLEKIRSEVYELDPLIDSSSLLRAYETSLIFSEVLAAELGPTTIAQFDCLAERSLGSAANLSLDEIDRIVAADPRLEPLPKGWKATTDFRLPMPGAESLFAAGRRVADHLLSRAQALGQAQANERKLKLVFGHGGAFRHAAMHLGVLAREDIPRLSMYHCQPVILQCASNGSWSHEGGAWKVRLHAPSDDV